VIAEPKNTGCTIAWLVCATTARHSHSYEGAGAGAKVAGCAHGDKRRCQPVGDGRQQGALLRADPVDLVGEEQGRDAQPLQGAHEDACLRLDTLDRGDHQHRSVEDAEGTRGPPSAAGSADLQISHTGVLYRGWDGQRPLAARNMHWCRT
jgi:hypothetical protein